MSNEFKDIGSALAEFISDHLTLSRFKQNCETLQW